MTSSSPSLVPGWSSAYRHTRSPKTGSGIATTAASAIAGCGAISASIAGALRFFASGSIDGDLDSYSFTAQAGQSIVASIGENGTNLTPNFRIQIFDKAGKQVAQKDTEFAGAEGTITFTAPTSGQYYIVASSADGNRGSYKMGVAVLGGPQVVDSDGGAIANGASVTGVLDGATERIAAVRRELRARGILDAAGRLTPGPLPADMLSGSGSSVATG